MIIMAYEDLISKIEQIEGQEQKRKREYFNSILSKLKTLEDMNYIERCRRMVETKERIIDSSFLAALAMIRREKSMSLTSNNLFKFGKDYDEIIVGNGNDDNIVIVCDVKNKRESKFNFIPNALTYYDRLTYTNIRTQDDKIKSDILSIYKTDNGKVYGADGSKTIQIDENKIVEFSMLTPELLQSMIDEFDEFENQFYKKCEQIVDEIIQESEKTLENDAKTECGDKNENNEQ